MLLHDYDDKEVVTCLGYGFPISQSKTTGSSSIKNNWPGPNLNFESVHKYFQVELRNKAVLTPFTENPFDHDAFYSPINTRDKKDSAEKRIITDMSFPKGNSVNDSIRKDEYLDQKINLKYPTVDNLVEILKHKGKGCLLFKCDLRQFYRQIPVCPKDYSKLGCFFNGYMYFDKVLVMGCHSSCCIAQRIVNALNFILQKEGVDCENYLDDLGRDEVPEFANYTFEKIGNLLTILKIEKSVSKACSPNTRMIFPAIIIDTLKMTLELDSTRLKEIIDLLTNWGNKNHAKLKEVQSLVGVPSFAATCIKQGRAFFTRILTFIDKCLTQEPH